MSSDLTSTEYAESVRNEWIPNRKNVGIPDNPFRYQFSHHIGPSIILGPFLKSRRVLAPVDQMFRQLYIQNLPKPTSLYLLLRILKRIKIGSWEIRKYLNLHGASTQKFYHRTRAAQLRDLILLRLFTEMETLEYYTGMIARHHGSRDLFAYLPYFEYIRITIQLQRDLFGTPPFFLNDKTSFSRWARNNDVTTPPEIVVQSRDNLASQVETDMVALGDEILIKPSRLLQGIGVETWNRISNGSWQRHGECLDSSSLVQHLYDLEQRYSCKIIVQKRIRNHPDLVPTCGDVLSTNRIITIINEAGDPEVVEHRWRMATDPDAEVDNFCAGGINWHIDNFDTGHLAFGDHLNMENTTGRMDYHPVHGHRMTGSFYPFQKEVIAFALASHRKMPNAILVGWDIAMTSTGPLALEVNFPPSAIVRQQTIWNGFENARIGQILGFHARRWLATMTPNHTTI